MANEQFIDPYHDLSVVLMENNRIEESVQVLEEVRIKSSGFEEKCRALFESAVRLYGKKYYER